MELRLMSTWEAREAASRGAVALAPFGSMEQHCDAPLGSDSIIVGEVARRACSRIEEAGVPCVLLPVVPYGYSPEWAGAPGTISLGLETMVGLVRDLLDSLWRHGYRRIALVNGHGGNSGVLEAAARGWAAERPGSLVIVVDYWRAAGVGVGHCCSIEEGLLSEVLGRPVVCACKGGIGRVRGARAIRLPGDPSGMGLEGRGRLTLDEAAGAVARVVLEALKLEGMSL